jgi:DNA adenine methylase
MSSPEPKPFVKWAGGKSQLLGRFASLFPANFNGYIEPFVGGGAVFYHLFSSGRLRWKRRLVLIDSNEELMNAYKMIKEDVQQVISLLSNGTYRIDRRSFERIRKMAPKDAFERAARLIYLNKTCYNGLYRVNRDNQFNVPYGRYKNPKILDEINLRVVSRSLKRVELLSGDFELCLEYAKKGDFIYLDPPYQPISKTSSFTNYTKDSFTFKDQERLADIFRQLDERGCFVMLSNSNNTDIERLYRGYNINEVIARRTINSKASGRGAINELAITSY